MTADELWEKYCKPEMIDNHFYDVMREKDFLAALSERDAYVKKECARVCMNWQEDGDAVNEELAAAIEKLEIK